MNIKIKKRTSILLLIASLILVTGISFAVFTYQANKKGVISTEAIDTFFASNYLKLCANQGSDEIDMTDPRYEGQTLMYTEGTDTVSFEFTVQNYLAGATAYNPNTIDYNLIILLAGNNTGKPAEYKLAKVTNGSAGNATTLFPDNSNKWTSSQTYKLQGGYNSVDTFQITMPTEALNNAQLLVIAQPTTDSLVYTNNKMLARLFSPCTEANVKGFEATHAFTDKLISGVMPSDLDAFNYEVSINTGSGWMTVTWDTRYVTIDPFFKDRVTLKSADKDNPYSISDNETSLTFKMDTAVASSCLIQFYRNAAKNAYDSWQSSWDDMESVIKSSATQITTTGE